MTLLAPRTVVKNSSAVMDLAAMLLLLPWGNSKANTVAPDVGWMASYLL